MKSEYIDCACGCGERITRRGKNGKPRRFVRGHQTKGTSWKNSEQYWDRRLQILHGRAKGCACGCGERVLVSLEWLQQRSDQKYVRIPLYKEGHTPLVECACGCGTLMESYSERNRPRQFFGYHGHVLSSGPPRVDWEERVAEYNRNAPLCACGCGRQLTRTVRQLQQYQPDVGFLSGHNQRRSCVTQITPSELVVIYGCLLGDMSITRPHNTATPRLQMNHCIAQKVYVQHKIKALQRLSWRAEQYTSMGYKKGGQMFRASSSCMPVFEDVWSVTRPHGGKQVSQEWLSYLTDESVAYWFMDDGSTFGNVNSYTSQLHTEGFSSGENELLAAWLREWGLPNVQVKVSRGYYFLYIPHRDAQHLHQRIKPYLIPSMEYKLRE